MNSSFSSIRNQTFDLFLSANIDHHLIRLVGLAANQKAHKQKTKQGLNYRAVHATSEIHQRTGGIESTANQTTDIYSLKSWYKRLCPVCRLGMLAPCLQRIGRSSESTWLQNSGWLNIQSWCWTEIWSWSKRLSSHCQSNAEVSFQEVLQGQLDRNLKLLEGAKLWFPADFLLSQSIFTILVSGVPHQQPPFQSPSRRYKECNKCMALRHLTWTQRRCWNTWKVLLILYSPKSSNISGSSLYAYVICTYIFWTVHT